MSRETPLSPEKAPTFVTMLKAVSVVCATHGRASMFGQLRRNKKQNGRFRWDFFCWMIFFSDCIMVNHHFAPPLRDYIIIYVWNFFQASYSINHCFMVLDVFFVGWFFLRIFPFGWWWALDRMNPLDKFMRSPGGIYLDLLKVSFIFFPW